MTRETALELTARLDEANISYGLSMSYIENLAPPKTYHVSVHFRPLTSERLRALEEIVEPFDVGVHFGLASQELALYDNAAVRRLV